MPQSNRIKYSQDDHLFTPQIELKQYVKIKEDELEERIVARKKLEDEIKELELKIREKFNVDDNQVMFNFDHTNV
jgi:hypothetical protein